MGQVQQTDSETNEREPEDTGQHWPTNSGRVRKRTHVDGMSECDTEITADEKEEGTRVHKAPLIVAELLKIFLRGIFHIPPPP